MLDEARKADAKAFYTPENNRRLLAVVKHLEGMAQQGRVRSSRTERPAWLERSKLAELKRWRGQSLLDNQPVSHGEIIETKETLDGLGR
jgi:hypothetical protein